MDEKVPDTGVIMDAYERRINLDRNVRTSLAIIVPVCLMFSTLLIILDPQEGMGTFMIRLCMPYVPAFCLLGIYVMFNMRSRSRKSDRRVIGWSVFYLLLATVLIMLYHLNIRTIERVTVIPLTGDILIDSLQVMLQLILAYFVVVTAGFGVMGVIVAYFRHYMVRIIRSLRYVRNDGTDNGRMKANIWIFDIPAIIDVQDVELEPIYSHGGFPRSSFRSMVTAMMIFSIILVSYIFLNPFFLLEMEGWEMVIIGMIITFFVPVFIIPWSITKDLGAKIKSQARDYYIWKGMKKRLYQSFMALGVVFLLVGLVFYLIDDLLSLAFVYMGYFIFSFCLSIIYSFIYFNYFQREFRDDIVRNYWK